MFCQGHEIKGWTLQLNLTVDVGNGFATRKAVGIFRPDSHIQ